MPTTLSTRKKLGSPQAGEVRELSGKALLKDMRNYQKRVAASPDAARDFLTHLGVLTPTGKPKRLIRG